MQAFDKFEAIKNEIKAKCLIEQEIDKKNKEIAQVKQIIKAKIKAVEAGNTKPVLSNEIKMLQTKEYELVRKQFELNGKWWQVNQVAKINASVNDELY